MLRDDESSCTETAGAGDDACVSMCSAALPGAPGDRGSDVENPKSTRGGASGDGVCPSDARVGRGFALAVTEPLEGGFNGMFFILEGLKALWPLL
ncbi:hypothetical protein BK670_02190 [Pseudomonas fluorescens]|uniref:Uncharacterized protein n=1 Tax=Pseudomonas fluorescens TaxID=294 RepID=A0A423MNU5_PSEFL|nr:hypothetical protein BK670_02190 [Pseudomonas fluorescens]